MKDAIELVTIAAAAASLAVSRRTVVRMIARGDLRAAKLGNGKGGAVRIPTSELARLVRERMGARA